MNVTELIHALRQLLGPEQVIDNPEQLAPYRHDWLPGDYPRPDLVVLPTRPEQIPTIVTLVCAAGLPIVARGAGTGLAGGARPLHGGVVIDMSHMNAIEQIDLANRQACVQAGLITYNLSAALAHDGWFYAPDPASWQICTIGGNIANNSGGPRCLKYGVTTNHILAVEVTLADCRQCWTGDGTATTTWHSYDITGLLVGSEGTFGIVSRALVRLTRTPEAKRVVMALFPDVVAACMAVSAILAAGYIPTALEVMDATTMLAVNLAQNANLPSSAGAALIIEIDGVIDGLDDTMSEIATLCHRHGAFELTTATTPEAQEQLWSARRSAFASFHTLAPSFYLVDTVVPRTRLPAMMAHIQRLSQHYGMPIANVFHAGDGNLHPLVLYDPGDPEQVAKTHAITGEVLKLSIDEGGAVSGEHGIGSEKCLFLPRLYSRNDLAAQAAVYHVFNPERRLNPGKVFPAHLDPLLLAQEHAARLAIPPIQASQEQIQRELTEIVGLDDIRSGNATAAFTVQGHIPQWVVWPDSTAELAAVMKTCYRYGLPVLPWGGGTRQAIGTLATPPAVVVVTRKLRRILHYEPDDLTIGVEAGMTLAELQTILAAYHQRFPIIMTTSNQSTLGGLVATATDSPLQTGYGALRDLVLGLTVVQVDGTVIHIGGQVVKNVSGYDLPKLFVGSYGTLGIITEVRLRTFPQPPATVTLVTDFPAIARLNQFLNELTGTHLCPVAVEIVTASHATGEIRAVVQFEGHPAACTRSVSECAALATRCGANSIQIEDGDQADHWAPIVRLASIPTESSTWPIRMAVLPAQFSTALTELLHYASQVQLVAEIAGRPYKGIIYGHLRGTVGAVARLLEALLEHWPHTQIPAGFLPPELEVARWGHSPVIPIAELSHRLKQAFDPYWRLNHRLWPFYDRSTSEGMLMNGEEGCYPPTSPSPYQ